MSPWTILSALIRALLPVAGMLLANVAGAEAGKLRLAEPLDRQYCLDVPGAGDAVMLWKPLIAHNCKQGGWDDERIKWSGDGPIRFPAYDRCVTAAGVKHATLPGSALLLRECQQDEPLQRFRRRRDGRVEQAESGLCLAVGPHSSPTWNPDHRWRRLSLEDCEGVAPERSVWRAPAEE